MINTWQEYVVMGAFIAILLIISGIPVKQS